MFELAGIDNSDSSAANRATYVLAAEDETVAVQDKSTPVAAATMTEEELAKAMLPLWQRVLGAHSITLDDDFLRSWR